MASSILDLPPESLPSGPQEITPRKSILDVPPGTSDRHAKILDAIDPAGKTVMQRIGEAIPRFSESIIGPDSPFPKAAAAVVNTVSGGLPFSTDPALPNALRGITKALTLDTVDIGAQPKTPETTGDAIWQAVGSVTGSAIFPMGPAVKLAPKIRGAKTVAGALANMAATEIETRFQASNRQLMLSGTLGALFGRFYREGGAPAKAVEQVVEDVPRVATPKTSGPLLLEDFSTPQSRAAGNKRPVDFYGSEAKPGTFPYETEGLQGQRVLPTEYTPATPANIDTLNKPYSVSSVEGPGLFKEMGVRDKGKFPKPGSTIGMAGQEAQSVLRKMKIHPDADVREAGRTAQTFLDNSQDIDTNGLQNTIEMAKQGKLPRDGLRIRIGEDPYEAEQVSRSMVRTGLGLFTRNLRSPEYAMADVETKSGGRIPAYDTFWSAQTARGVARQAMTKVGAIANTALKGMGRVDDSGLLAYFTAPDELKGTVASSLGLSNETIKRGNVVMDEVGKMWSRIHPDTPFNKYMQEIVPAMRNESQGALDVLRHDPAMTDVEQWAASHEMNYQARGLRDFAASHIRAFAMKEHFDGEYGKLMEIAANRNGTYPAEYAKYVGDWAQGLRGTRSIFAKNFGPVLQKALQRVGIKNVEQKDVSNVVNNFIALSQTGMIGFKPSTMLKAAFHPLMTGSRIGNNWMWYGLKKGLTKAGYEMGELAGMHDTAATEMGAFQELQGQGGISRGIKSMASTSLSPLGTLRDYAKRAMYIAGHDRFMDAAKVGASRDQVIKDSGLLRFHPAIRDHVMDQWAARNTKGAAHLMGVHAAQATQWEYTGEFRPVGLQSDEARVFTQMGIWPLNYGEYLRQMATIPMAAKERAKWFLETGMNQASIVGAMTAMGAAVGLKNEAFKHAMDWVGIKPAIDYKGSPTFDFITALPKLVSGSIKSTYSDDPTPGLGEAWKSAKRDLLTLVPGAGVHADLAEAYGPVEQTAENVDPFLAMQRSDKTVASPDAAQELFRFMTGTRVRQ